MSPHNPTEVSSGYVVGVHEGWGMGMGIELVLCGQSKLQGGDAYAQNNTKGLGGAICKQPIMCASRHDASTRR